VEKFHPLLALVTSTLDRNRNTLFKGADLASKSKTLLFAAIEVLTGYADSGTGICVIF
jgi:hypothetical protein